MNYTAMEDIKTKIDHIIHPYILKKLIRERE